MKTCNKCQIVKPFSLFYKNKSKKDGYQGHCKVCSNLAVKDTYKNNKESKSKTDSRNKNRRKRMRLIIDNIKISCGCSLCKENTPICLDFHHLNPDEKEKKPTTLVDYGFEELILELNKCILLCSNCHRKVHAGVLLCPNDRVPRC